MESLQDRVKGWRHLIWLDSFLKFVDRLRDAIITILVIGLAFLFLQAKFEGLTAVDQGWKAVPLFTVPDLMQQKNARLVSVVGVPRFEGISSASERVIDWSEASTCNRIIEETTYKLHQDTSPTSPSVYMILERKACMSGWIDTKLPEEETRFTGWWSPDEHHITTKEGARKRDIDTFTLWIESDDSG